MSDSGSFSPSSSRTTWRSQLEAWQAHLDRARPVESFHVTLAFLGARPRSELESIVSALRESAAETRPFELQPVRLPRDALRRNARSPGRERGGDPARTRSAATGWSDSACIGARARPWLPHVTVVRFRERPRLDPPLPPLGRFAPSGAAAFLSRLRPTGARYETLESYPFGA